tara:strand:- start:8428 stop:9297 length:870 start_codon:yes stop_codon:yes gene_type:complete
MKLLFENWRKYLNEDEDPISKRRINDVITDEFSFNLLPPQGKDHHFTPGEPVIDYGPHALKYFDEQTNELNFIAWTTSNPVNKEKPDLKIEKEETLEAFLTRVKEASSQIELDVLKELALPFSSQAKMEKAVKELNPDQQNLLQKLKDHFTDCPSEEEFKDIIVKLVGVTALAPGGLIYGSVPLLYNLIKMAKCHGLTEESLYYGTSTIFQEEIVENGIKSPSEWGNYGLAEENAFKIVEEHGGEPVIIQIPLSEFKKEHFLLDESSLVTMVYTEDLPIFMEKQQQKLL